ncbi:3056_t:CDS:1, partial [Acaulospora colombiana]
EKKLNNMKKITRLVKETPADLKLTPFQTQQFQACSSQVLTRMDNPSSLSWSDRFEKEIDSTNNSTGTAASHEMGKKL